MEYDINRYPAQSGRIIGEDGKVYNLVDLLRDIAINTGGITPESPTIGAVTPTTEGATIELM